MLAWTVGVFGSISLFLLTILLLFVCVCLCARSAGRHARQVWGAGPDWAPSAGKISVRVGGDDPRLTCICPTPLASVWRRPPSQEVLLLHCLLTGREKPSPGYEPQSGSHREAQGGGAVNFLLLTYVS